jgi:gliding motility-associated-like protein
VSNPDSVIVIPDLEPDTAYSVVVTLIDDQGGSTTALQEDLGSQPVVQDDIIEVAQVTYEPTGWQLRWRWNQAAGYGNTSFEIRRGSQVVVQTDTDPALDILPAPTVPLGVDATFDWGNAEVVVISTDVCGVTRESEPARPAIVFARETGPLTVAVDWQVPQGDPLEVTEWNLRFLDLVGSRLLLQTDSLLSYEHDVENVNFREVCYEVVSEVRLPAVFRRPEARFLWRSAPACALRSPRVFLPTGFIPEGYTISYRPRVSLIEGLTYEMKIYDRWGKVQFETDDPFSGWDGRTKGNEAPTGSYLAIVKMEEAGREPIRIEQVFTLVR